MAENNSELLAMMADLVRATDRQTEENKRSINQLREEFTGIFDRFATAVVDGFIRVEGKIDAVKQEVASVKQEVAGVKQEVAGVKQEVAGVKQEVAELRQDVQQIDRRLGRIEHDLPNYLDVARRLTVLEAIVLNKAS